ncbi:hypothetical protein IAT40_005899 [Kwoniella sp. CBS 6097]
MITSFTLLLLGCLASVAPSVMATDASVYIDFTGDCGNTPQDVAGAGVGPGWSDNLHGQPPKCDGQRGWNYTQLATNQIVAVDLSLFSGDFSDICGKEIIITKQDGSIFKFSEGPLYAWEGCGNCNGGDRVDLAAKPFVELNGGACGPNNPQILKWEFGDYIVDPSVGLTPSGGGGGAANATAVGAPAGSTAVVPPPASSAPVGASSSITTGGVLPSSPLVPSVPTAPSVVPTVATSPTVGVDPNAISSSPTAAVPPVSTSPSATVSASAPIDPNNPLPPASTNTAVIGNSLLSSVAPSAAASSLPVVPSVPSVPSAPSAPVAPSANPTAPRPPPTTSAPRGPGGWGNWARNVRDLVAARGKRDATSCVRKRRLDVSEPVTA